MDVLINDFKKITVNDSVGIKKLKLLKEIHSNLELNSTVDIAKQFEKTKSSLTIEKKAIITNINKKKYLFISHSRIYR